MDPVVSKRPSFAAAAMFCIFFVTLAPNGVAALEKSVTLTTDPPGAAICERVERNLVCSRSTPVSFTVDFRSDISSKRYYLRKLGYEPVTALISYSEPENSFRLKKQEIFPAPSEHSSAEMQSLQGKINQAIGDLIYRGRLGLPDYVFVGKIQPVNIAGKVYVKVEVLLDDEFRKGPYRKLSRIRDEGERNRKLAEEVLLADTGNLIVALGGALRGAAGVHGVMLAARYARIQLVPVDDDTTFTHVYRQYTGQTVSGGYVYDNYLVTYRTLTTGYTKLEQQSQIQTALFYAPLPAIPAKYDPSNSPAALLKGSSVFVNDNRRNEMVEVNK